MFSFRCSKSSLVIGGSFSASGCISSLAASYLVGSIGLVVLIDAPQPCAEGHLHIHYAANGLIPDLLSQDVDICLGEYPCRGLRGQLVCYLRRRSKPPFDLTIAFAASSICWRCRQRMPIIPTPWL